MTPQLVDAYKSLEGKKDRKVEVILLNYDTDQKKMNKYMIDSKINFPGLKQAETKENYLSEIKQIEGLPTIVITDADGKVVDSGAGGDAEKMIAKMKELAK